MGDLEQELKAAIGTAFIEHVREHPELARQIFSRIAGPWATTYPAQKTLTEWLIEPNEPDAGAELPGTFADTEKPSWDSFFDQSGLDDGESAATETDDHIALTDLYPNECTRYGYRAVGLAQRRVMAATPSTISLSVIKQRTRELLADPQQREELQREAAEMLDEHDPWRWAIERSNQ